MDEEPAIKKLAEATKGGDVCLVSVWNDGTVGECFGKVIVPNTYAPSKIPDRFDCENTKPSMPATSFFEKLGNLSRQGYDVRVLYDSETVSSELGDLGSLRQGRL